MRLGLNVDEPRPGSKTLAAAESGAQKTFGANPSKPDTSEPLENKGNVVKKKATGKASARASAKVDPSEKAGPASGVKKRANKTAAKTGSDILAEINQAKDTRPVKKRRGVETSPIMKALKNAPARSRWGKDWLALDFPGGRLLSYNELYSILQYRKYEAFRYKKVCREAVANALGNPEPGYDHAACPRPYFNSPTRLTLVRVGAKEMDREALTVIFKYMTDALRAQGVIEDDNPNIIVDIQTRQAKGPERLAMRLDRVPDWADPGVPQWDEWK